MYYRYPPIRCTYELTRALTLKNLPRDRTRYGDEGYGSYGITLVASKQGQSC